MSATEQGQTGADSTGRQIGTKSVRVRSTTKLQWRIRSRHGSKDAYLAFRKTTNLHVIQTNWLSRRANDQTSH